MARVQGAPGASHWWAHSRAARPHFLREFWRAPARSQRQGTVEAGSTVGDGSAEARHHKMSVELSVATTNFLGDNYTFIDCPGSVEFVHDMRAALPAVDAAVVVCEADEKKIPQLQLILRELEDQKIPRFLFLNKIDKADKRVRETLKLLQPASRVPLVLRQIPIWSNEIVVGFVDLALERAHIYKEHAPSEVVPLEGENADRKKEARFTMLELLADHDDELMEQLLDDIPPPRDKVFDDLAKELRDGLICPVLIGSATRTNGVLRLMKALRHEAPGMAETVSRLGVKPGGEAVASVFKTLHTAHGGKMSIARVFAGQAGDGTTFVTPETEAGRVSGVFKLMGQGTEKRGAAAAGETVALGKLDHAQDRRHAERRQAGARHHRAGHALSAGAGDRDRRQGAQGRREARPGAQQADRRGPLAHRGAQPRDARDRGVGAGRDAPARRDRAPRRPLRRRRSSGASRPSAIARRSRSRYSTSAGGTRSSPAATASSATW